MESANVADHIERVTAGRRKALIGAYNLILNAHSKLSRSGRGDLAGKLYEAIEAVREAAFGEGEKR